MIYQKQSNPVIKKERNFTSTRTFLIVLLLLAFGGAMTSLAFCQQQGWTKLGLLWHT
jgi:hypothetical protein